nr:reverse transcriptase domain-containing protein [Tanacetum cinerariifolium]
MAGPQPITPLNEGTSNQNSKSIIEGHVSALKELLKEPSNLNLIKPMLLDFDDIQDVSNDEVQDDVKGKTIVDEEDLSKPFKEILKCPFTRRIVEFSSPGHKMTANVKIYDGTGDPKDHMGRFMGIRNQGEWPMPDKFLNRFGMLKACDKDPTEISKIDRRANETLPHFKERWVSESNAILNVPELIQISSFMSSHKCPELAKRFSDSIPKTMDKMLKRVDDYLRSKEAFCSTKLPRGSSNEETHRYSGYNEMTKANDFLIGTTVVGVPSKENLNRFCDYHNEKGHSMNDCFHLKQHLELALESGKLNHLIKDVRQMGKGGQRNNGPQKAKVINMVQSHPLDQKRKTTMTYEGWMNVPIIFPPIPARDLSEEALVVEAKVKGYLVQRIHIDEGASIEIMFEHCFNMLHPSIGSRTSRLKAAQGSSFYHSWDDEISNPLRVATVVSQTPMVLECRSERKKQVVEPSENTLTKATIKYKWQTKTKKKPPSIQTKVHIAKQRCHSASKMQEQRTRGWSMMHSSPKLEKNLEVYVDDMVVKSETERGMLSDIAETFNNLRRINVKLNPKKCSFGVMKGKFLGYMVTLEGIRANPTKTKDIAEMQSPRTRGEMQTLAGKLAVLNRFLSRLAKKSLPFFETLKDITKKKRTTTVGQKRQKALSKRSRR